MDPVIASSLLVPPKTGSGSAKVKMYSNFRSLKVGLCKKKEMLSWYYLIVSTTKIEHVKLSVAKTYNEIACLGLDTGEIVSNFSLN